MASFVDFFQKLKTNNNGSPTCRKTAESFWYSFTSCRLAMVSITPMAVPANPMAMDSSMMWWQNGMKANTSEMMRVQKKRASRDDRRLEDRAQTATVLMEQIRPPVN